MAIQIPLRPDLTDYDLQVSLDGTVYTLRFRWNARSGAYYMDVLTEDQEPIIMGKAVVLDLPLAGRCRDARFWPGVLLAIDTTQKHTDPGLGDLGGRVVLVYWPSDELPVDPTAPIPE